MSTYAEVIAERLRNKIVQIYFGDNYEQTHYDDSTRNVPATIIGKIVDADGDCLIVDSFYLDEKRERKFGNIQYINSYNIYSIIPLDGHGSLKEAIESAHAIKKNNL
jgi:hypothetical protein